MGLRDATNLSWGGGSKKLLGMLNPFRQVFKKKTFTKIEVHAGMAKQMVRYLENEEALQEEIKETLEHNNQSYDEWCAQTEQGKNKNYFSCLYMIVSMI